MINKQTVQYLTTKTIHQTVMQSKEFILFMSKIICFMNTENIKYKYYN